MMNTLSKELSPLLYNLRTLGSHIDYVLEFTSKYQLDLSNEVQATGVLLSRNEPPRTIQSHLNMKLNEIEQDLIQSLEIIRQLKEKVNK